MFSGFFGKGNNSSGKTPSKDAADSRGLEVVEDDPDTAWSMWDSALAEQDSRFPPVEPEASVAPAAEPTAPAPRIQAKPMPPTQAPALTVPMGLGGDAEAPTQPLDITEKTPEQRKNDALDVVDLYHHRIANTIRTMWGYKECSIYINKLIMAGGDGMGNSRVGFNQEAVAAMLALADLHDAQFGPMEAGGGELGFADPTSRGFGGSRRL